VHVVPVDADPGLVVDRVRDVGRRHAAEELALLPGMRRDADRCRSEARGDLLGFGLGGVDPDGVRPLEAAHVVHAALRGFHREAARHQVVARVAVGDVDDIARHAELVDRLLEDDLHRVEYGSSAISRAFLTATATSR
jgi:hypothetical protein